jgi:hypothetical protein
MGPELVASAAQNPLLVAWRQNARHLRQNNSSNSAEANALAWLKLAEQRLDIPLPNAEQPDGRPSFAELVQSLPAPAQWPAILKKARVDFQKESSQANASNWYFAARLQNDGEEQIEALRALHRILTPQFEATKKRYAAKPNLSAKARRNLPYEQINAVSQDFAPYNDFGALLRDSPQLSQQIEGFKWQVEASPFINGGPMVFAPDLVTQIGAKAAKPLVQKVLQSEANLAWYGADKTSELARKVWLSDPRLQTKPNWNLVTSAKDWKLALVMLDKVPTKGDGFEGWSSIYPRSYALAGLLESGRFKEASQKLAAWQKLNLDGLKIAFPYLDAEVSRPLQLQQLSWLESTLQRFPDLDWWEGYQTLALRLGQMPRALKLARSVVENNRFARLPAEQRRTHLVALSKAYLFSNQAQPGGDALVRALQNSAADKAINEGISDDLLALLRLTRVVPNQKWMQVAHKSALSLFAPRPSHGNDSRDAKLRMRIALLLAAQNQQVFAQSLLANALKPASGLQGGAISSEDTEVRRIYLYGLMVIYQRANQPTDMVYLMENARGWGEKELTPLLTFNGSDPWDNDSDNPDAKAMPRLGYLAAWALAKTNRKAEAQRIVKAFLERQGGDDRAYRLLCDLEGERARPFLQKLAAADRFEERPLIWQAYLSRQGKRWDEAENLARQAIAIDPSDGEQGPGDRLRAYAELGAALQGQGKTKEAQKMETAVGAIRLAEKADGFRLANLVPQAISLYEKSLGYFDNAYCVQSRLAVQLVGLGRFDEAGEHFRRAYELMPSSFGRLESHCFGCEGVFGGVQQNGIAREVFLQLEKASPHNPKVAYLAGYWRQYSGQDKDAIRYYEKAVRIDPDYLSAWKQITNFGQTLTPQQSDRATLRVIELDPRGTHDSYGGVNYNVKRDYRGLWSTTSKVIPRIAPQSKADFALMGSVNDENWNSYSTWELVKKPADAIAGQDFVRKVSVLTG